MGLLTFPTSEYIVITYCCQYRAIKRKPESYCNMILV